MQDFKNYNNLDLHQYKVLVTHLWDHDDFFSWFWLVNDWTDVDFISGGDFMEASVIQMFLRYVIVQIPRAQQFLQWRLHVPKQSTRLCFWTRFILIHLCEGE